MTNQYPNKEVYECINSHGFEEPFVYVEIDHAAIKTIWKITLDVVLMHYTCDEKNDGYHGFGCNGNCVDDEEDCYTF